MPAATTKSDLLTVTEKEFTTLYAVISRIGPQQALRERPDGTSIKDVIAHRAHWVQLFFGWYSDGQLGRDLAFPAKGYTWADLPDYNMDLRARHSGLSWSDAQELLLYQHEALLIFLARLNDAQLYGAPMKGAHNHWTTGRWAEAAGASHYRSAAKWIRACVRADAQAQAETHYA